MSNPAANPILHTPYVPGPMSHQLPPLPSTTRACPSTSSTLGPYVHNQNDAATRGATQYATVYPLSLPPTPLPNLPLARTLAALSLQLEYLRYPSRPANRTPKTPPASPTTSSSHPTLPSDPARHHGQSKIQSKIAINITLAHTPRLAPLRSDDPRLGQLYQPQPQYYLSQTPVPRHGLSYLLTPSKITRTRDADLEKGLGFLLFFMDTHLLLILLLYPLHHSFYPALFLDSLCVRAHTETYIVRF